MTNLRRIFSFLSLTLSLWGCSSGNDFTKDNININDATELRFGFTTLDSNKINQNFSALADSDANVILTTLNVRFAEYGSTVYNDFNLSLTYENGVYYTDVLTVNPVDHFIDQFRAWNADETIFYSVPQEDSEYSYLVFDNLPYKFTADPGDTIELMLKMVAEEEIGEISEIANSDVNNLEVKPGNNPLELTFSWGVNANDGHGYYELQANPNGQSGFTTVLTIDDKTITSANLPLSIFDTNFIDTQYILQSFDNKGNMVDSTNQVGLLNNVTPAQITGYFKANNAESGDRFGVSAALDQDGVTLVIGSYLEDGNGIVDNDNTLSGSGAVYVFERSGNAWSQTAYLKASNLESKDYFGRSVALSDDGGTLIVGAYQEDSSSDLDDNAVNNSGAVYVFKKENDNWDEVAYLKADNAGVNDYFGESVAIGRNGSTLVVGARYEDSDNSSTDDNSVSNAGAVYVFEENDDSWEQIAYLKSGNIAEGGQFGRSVALSDSATVLAVGAPYEDHSNSDAKNSGMVYVFENNSGDWELSIGLRAENADAADYFGWSVALNSDGNVLAVGAIGEDDSNNTVNASGAVYVFERGGNDWNQSAYLKANNAGEADYFGWSLTLDNNATILVIGAPYEDSSNDHSDDNTASAAGAVYVFERNNKDWSQMRYLKASNVEHSSDHFGVATALSGDGKNLAVGAYLEDGNATGVSTQISDSNAQDSDSAFNSGAVYLY